MTYTKIFDPKAPFRDFREEKEKQTISTGDQREGKVYQYDEDIILAINVALATGRPLFLEGDSGCGKSSIACNIARVMGSRYYEFVVTARSRARDLLYDFDAVRRLADAQVKQSDQDNKEVSALAIPNEYVNPGPLWWILDPDTAKKKGSGKQSIKEDAKDPGEHYFDSKKHDQPGRPVLLIDEIDKAELDFPNNLLVSLGSSQFSVPEIGHTIKLKRDTEKNNEPLVIITTNRERRMPEPFLRRCIFHQLNAPDASVLLDIAKNVMGSKYEPLCRKLLGVLGYDLEHPEKMPVQKISTAEYLDAVCACINLKAEDQMETILDHITGKGQARLS